MPSRPQVALAALIALAALAPAAAGASAGTASATTPGAPPGGGPVPVAAMVDTNGDAPGGLEVRAYEAGSADEAASLVADLAQRGDVVAAEVDGPVRLVEALPRAAAPGAPGGTAAAAAPATAVAAGATSAGPLRAQQWGLDRLSAETAWMASTGTDVVVAVLDTGVRADHEDLAGRVLPGANFVGADYDGTGPVTPVSADVADGNGHGTHVAGVVAAGIADGVGGAGLAPGARVLPVKVLDDSGAGLMSEVAAGIVWAADQGADILNLSLGSRYRSSLVASAVAYATGTRDAVVVVAAGNCGDPATYATAGCASVDEVAWPAAEPDVLAVGATNDADRSAPWLDEQSSFSSQGAHLDLAAPGSGIRSTCAGSPTSYCAKSGTSMAAPFVAAAAALVRAQEPALSQAAVRSLLLATADDVGAPGVDAAFGAGLVDPVGALGTSGPALARGRYWVTDAGGRVRPLGAAPDLGGVGHLPLNQPVVGLAPTPTGDGYWLVATDGGIFSFGDAGFHGSTGSIRLNQPIVAMTPTPSGHGYWFVAADGGVFAFGDAGFHGSTGDIRLNQPVVGMAATPTGGGYWLVARDGGIFAFGDAAFHGSTGDIRLNQPIVDMAAAPDGAGYWMVAEDGGIFSFGAAPFHGAATGASRAPALAVEASPSGHGYWVVTRTPQVLAFGDATPLP